MPQRRDVGTRYAIEMWRHQYKQWCETSFADLPSLEAAEAEVSQRFPNWAPTRIVEYVTTSRVIRD